MNRRDFMKTTVLASAATAMAGSRATAATAPSDRLRIGFIGCGARAQQLMQAALAMSDVEAVALCDAYTGRLDRARARTGGKATVYKEYRELLASPAVDLDSAPLFWLELFDHGTKTSVDSLLPPAQRRCACGLRFLHASG